MSVRNVTARVKHDGVEVVTPNTRFSVARRDDNRGMDSCPVDYLAGALGS